MLGKLHFKTTPLHSILPQHERLRSLNNFKMQSRNILVSTDVGSRGLDIPQVNFYCLKMFFFLGLIIHCFQFTLQVDLVVNFDVPHCGEDYVHRVGRTARVGRRGIALTLITQFEISLVQEIEERLNIKLGLAERVRENDCLKFINQVFYQYLIFIKISLFVFTIFISICVMSFLFIKNQPR